MPMIICCRSFAGYRPTDISRHCEGRRSARAQYSSTSRWTLSFRTMCIHDSTDFIQHTNSAWSTTVIYTVTTPTNRWQEKMFTRHFLSCFFFYLRPIFRPHQTCQGVTWLSIHLKQQFSHQNNLTGKVPLGRCNVPCVLRLCDRQTGTSMAPVHVASVKQTTGPNTAAFTNKNFNTLMCCGAMLSKKKSVLILRKSKKDNATASLVFTARFTPQSAWDISVIKLGRHTCPDKAIWHAVWQAPERGYGPGWPEVLPPSLASLARPADGCFGLNANALWNLWSRVSEY